ncbi:MAG: hypothetical protein JOZ51_15385, partial [Chloroflexi bacterium]|nr:hypothetical protein [Chloroflexota bacterium]
MSDLQHNLADLSPERRRLLDLLLRQKAQSDPAQILSLPRASGTNTFPLSFAQQRLWFIDQLQPGISAYNIAVGMRLHGPLDVATLNRALNQLVERHETLRTTFVLQENQPVQAIAPQLTIPLPLVDLSAQPAAKREAAALGAVAETADQPFDLERGPLFRATLFRLADDRHMVLLTMHHIIADGWSTGVLLREIAALYRSNIAGQPQALPALAIQYADFAQWQRRWLAPGSPRLASQIDYWRTQLADVSKLLLPTDHPRTAEQKMTSARENHMLQRELTAALHSLSQREGATLFQTLLTAFQVLLARYTGQSDIAVGSGIANRNRAE